MNVGYPIRIVAKKTGMSPHLIRMWERRYGLIRPERTSTGRRLYNDEDIERLTLLRKATLEGQSISQIATLTIEQLRELTPPVEADKMPGLDSRLSDNVENHLELCLQAMKDLDSTQLEMRLLRASLSLGQQVFVERLLHPLLEITGDMWSSGRLSVAHEHLASAVVRSVLGSMQLSSNIGSSAPLIVSTTPSGQLHEFGALMALVSAAARGWRTLYLGPNLPAEDIERAASERGASAIALSIVYPSDDTQLPDQLRKLRQLVPDHIPLLVGGRSAHAYQEVLDEIGAIKTPGLQELKEELNRIRRNLPRMINTSGRKWT